jgi:hypothetical protein
MLIQEMLRRFRPVYAADGEGTPGASEAAAQVAAIVNAGEPAEEAGEEEFELPDDIVTEGGEEPEFEDYDLDGVKVKVPKTDLQKIRDAAYRQSDYTVKTKEIAAKVKEAETAKANYEARAQADETFNEGVFHLKNIDADLGKRYQYFSSPEYRQLREDDPLKARSLYDDFQMDKDKREALAGALGRMHQERNSKAADEAKAQADANSRLREQALQKVSKNIPGWNADRQAKTREAAISRGYAAEAIDSITDPLHWEDLFYADIGRRAYASKARAGSGAARTQAAPGATRTVGQGGPIAGNVNTKLDKASPDDYVKMRQAQMAKK